MRYLTYIFIALFIALFILTGCDQKDAAREAERKEQQAKARAKQAKIDVFLDKKEKNAFKKNKLKFVK